MKTRVLKTMFVLMLSLLSLPMMAQDWMEIHFLDGSFSKFILDDVTGIFTSKFDADGKQYSDYQFQYVTTTDGVYVYDIDEIINIEFLKSESYGSVYFWTRDTYYPDETDDVELNEPTETEQFIMQLTFDEDAVPSVTYTEEDSLKYDLLAQEVISLFATEEPEEANEMPRKRLTPSDDEMAEEAIREKGINNFTGFEIEHRDDDYGPWGNTRYGKDVFETFYNTYIENSKRYMLVVFYHKGGFPNKKTACLKLGQVNNGPIIDKVKKIIYPGQEYVFIKFCLDDYLKGYGCANIFPLLITEDTKARYYRNSIMVKHKPIISTNNWRNQSVGYEFGKINGVSVYFNDDSENGNTNLGDGDYQCVELCGRYIHTLYEKYIKREASWSNAWNWPYARENDAIDQGKYIVFRNDGKTKVREGDFIVWQYKQRVYNKKTNEYEIVDRGHIGVVIKSDIKGSEEDYISIAQQNAGKGNYAFPIGAKMKVVDGIVYDIWPKTNIGTVYTRTSPPKDPTYFIRIKGSGDVDKYSDYKASMKASTTNIQFGSVEKGDSRTRKFRITNSGTSDLTISSIKLAKGEVFSTDATSCTIDHGESKVFSVTFKPTKSGVYEDRMRISSNADDNPTWYIKLSGTCEGDMIDDTMPTEGLVAYYPFNGNANDESGNGNHGSVRGNVVLTSDRFGNANSAYRFPGQPFNYISVPDDETLHCSTFTLNAWVYTDAENYGSGYLINKGRDINNGSYRLLVRDVGATNLYGGSNDAYIDDNPETGVWHMVTGTVEGKTARYYLDGVLMDERTLSYPFVYNNSDPLTLGMHYYSGVPSYWAYPLLGVMDDVRIYNRVLSPSEIKTLYHEPNGE